MKYFTKLLCLFVLFLQAFAGSGTRRPCDKEKEALKNLGRKDVHIPKCDRKGLFLSKQRDALNDRCWCVDIYTGTMVADTKTRCDKLSLKTCDLLLESLNNSPTTTTTTQPDSDCVKKRNKQLQKNPDNFVYSCDSDGLYDAVQKYDGHCWCANRYTGESSGNMDKCRNFNAELCYEAKGSVSTATATTTTSTKPIVHLHKGPCTQKRQSLMDMRLMDAHIPSCNSDGTFSPEQRYGFTDTCWCADKITGDAIKGTTMLCNKFDLDCEHIVKQGVFNAIQTTTTTTTTTAVTTTIATRPKPSLPSPCLLQASLAQSSLLEDLFVPACNADGSFVSTQAHEEKNICWCARPDTGDTIEGTKMPCDLFLFDCDQIIRHTDDNFLKTTATQPVAPTKTTTTRTTTTTPLTTTPTITTAKTPRPPVGASIGLTRPGKGPCTLKIEMIKNSGLLDAHFPDCNEDGTFSLIQRYRYTRTCWCADRHTGEILKGTSMPCERFNKEIDCNKITLQKPINSGLSICEKEVQYGASSYYREFKPEEARLNGIGWSAKGRKFGQEYLEITFDSPQHIASIRTKGALRDKRKEEFVKEFYIQYKVSEDAKPRYFSENGRRKRFKANEDATTEISINFEHGDFEAIQLRIYPSDAKKYIYLRAGVFVYC